LPTVIKITLIYHVTVMKKLLMCVPKIQTITIVGLILISIVPIMAIQKNYAQNIKMIQMFVFMIIVIINVLKHVKAVYMQLWAEK